MCNEILFFFLFKIVNSEDILWKEKGGGGIDRRSNRANTVSAFEPLISRSRLAKTPNIHTLPVTLSATTSNKRSNPVATTGATTRRRRRSLVCKSSQKLPIFQHTSVARIERVIPELAFVTVISDNFS